LPILRAKQFQAERKEQPPRLTIKKPNTDMSEKTENKHTSGKLSDASPCSAKFVRLQPVKFPLSDGTYQNCLFIGVDSEGVATVKTKGRRYRTVWDCNLYPQNSQRCHGENK